MIRAVIFDWAGTVVDFGSKAPVLAFRAAFADAGIELSEAEVRAPMGKAKRDHIAAVLALPAVRARLEMTVDDALVDSLYERFLALQGAVVEEHSELIEGVAPVVDTLRARGIRIGSSTGYTRELLDRVMPRAEREGYCPDFSATASDGCAGRPAPWMIYRNCEALGAYPMHTVVKVDDTVVGLEAARNASCWAVGVAASGNAMGLDAAAYAALAEGDRRERLAKIEEQLRRAGAHEVIATLADFPACLERIEARLAGGERP